MHKVDVKNSSRNEGNTMLGEVTNEQIIEWKNKADKLDCLEKQTEKFRFDDYGNDIIEENFSEIGYQISVALGWF